MLLSLCLGRTRVEETFSLNALWWLNIYQLPHEFSVSVSCNSKTKVHYESQTYDTNIVTCHERNYSRLFIHSSLCLWFSKKEISCL